MELKMPGSRTVTRKHAGSGERRGPPPTVGTTTNHPWRALFWHSSILSCFHGHSDL